MGMCGLPSADKTWLGGDKSEVFLVAVTALFCDHECAFVDARPRGDFRGFEEALGYSFGGLPFAAKSRISLMLQSPP
jgi:hypothetical protein